jgi:hypothetical protein
VMLRYGSHMGINKLNMVQSVVWTNIARSTIELSVERVLMDVYIVVNKFPHLRTFYMISRGLNDILPVATVSSEQPFEDFEKAMEAQKDKAVADAVRIYEDWMGSAHRNAFVAETRVLLTQQVEERHRRAKSIYDGHKEQPLGKSIKFFIGSEAEIMSHFS